MLVIFFKKKAMLVMVIMSPHPALLELERELKRKRKKGRCFIPFMTIDEQRKHET